ncbi:thioester protein reductase domain, partial [Mytilus galloprovincialis]
MSGDRKQAFWNPQDFTLLVLQACAKYGYTPDVDWDMEMTPVDFAAEFIVRCTYNLSTILGKTYHIINDQPLHSRILEESQKNGSNGSFTASIQRLLESYLTYALIIAVLSSRILKS